MKNQIPANRKGSFQKLEAPPPDLRDLSLLRQNVMRAQGRFCHPCHSGRWVDARVASLRCPILCSSDPIVARG